MTNQLRRRKQATAPDEKPKAVRVVAHKSIVVKRPSRAKKVAELVVEDTSRIAWHFFLGCLILIYTLFFLVGTLIFYLTLEFFLFIIREGVVYGIEAIGDVIGAIVSVINAVAGALSDVANAGASVASDVSSFCGGPSFSAPSIPKLTVSSVVGSWYTTMLNIDTTCFEMNTWQKVLFALIKILFSRFICPTLRFVSPSWWVIKIMDPLLSWASFPYLPIPSQNCQEPDGELLCAFLNFYLVIGGLIIPLLYYKAILDSFKESGFLHDLISLLKPIVKLILRLLYKILP